VNHLQPSAQLNDAGHFSSIKSRICAARSIALLTATPMFGFACFVNGFEKWL